MIAGVVVWLKNQTMVQLVCLSILFYWIAKYQLVNQPFKSQINNFLNTINEFFLFCFSLMLFSFRNIDSTKRHIIWGYIWVGMLGVFFIINWGIILPLKLADLSKSIKEKWWWKKRERTDITHIVEEAKKVRKKRIKNNKCSGIPTPRFPNHSGNDEPMNKYRKTKIQKIVPKRARNGQRIPDLPMFREVRKAQRRKPGIKL